MVGAALNTSRDNLQRARLCVAHYGHGQLTDNRSPARSVPGLRWGALGPPVSDGWTPVLVGLFEDISGTALTGRLGNLDCSAVPHSCENITLRDVHLKPSLGGGKGKFQCTNAAGAKWILFFPGILM